MPVYQLPSYPYVFPHPLRADQDGLLAIGGDLDPERLILAYQHGIFPWYNHDDPILWWFPNPRLVLFPSKIRIAKSMRSYFNQQKYSCTYNQQFTEVMINCKNHRRPGQTGTWIQEEMVEAYTALHRMGIAQSVEVWEGNELVGGLYGVQLNRIFFGESMYAHKSNASKFGLIKLAQKLAKEDVELIDCQQDTPHLKSLGAELISSKQFHDIIQQNRLKSLIS